MAFTHNITNSLPNAFHAVKTTPRQTRTAFLEPSWRFAGALILCVALGGCVPAKTLAPLAQQNKTNLNDLSMNIRTASRMRSSLVSAVGTAYVLHRVTDIAFEFNATLGLPEDAIAPDATWASLLNKTPDLKRKYNDVREARASRDVAKDMDRIKRDAGWVYTANVDPDFTPAKAKELQVSLGILRSTYLDKGDTRMYVQRACELLGDVDPALTFRRDTAKAITDLNEKLDQAIASQLDTANGHADLLLKVTEADVNLAAATSSALASPDTQSLVGKLAARNISDSAVRQEAVKLLSDAVATTTSK